MRQIPEEEQLYRGVQAPQRKAVSEQAEVTEMPKVRGLCCPELCLRSLNTLGVLQVQPEDLSSALGAKVDVALDSTCFAR